MFGKKEEQLSIDYSKLAEAVVKIQLEHLENMDEPTFQSLFANAYTLVEEHLRKKNKEERTPIGRVSQDTLDEFKKFSDKCNGLELIMDDLLRKKSELAYEKRSLWNRIRVELDNDLDGARIDLKTGDIYYINPDEE